MFALFLTLMLADLKVDKVFQKVPEDNEHEIFEPSVLIERAGKLYLLDPTANGVFIWDAESGAFLRSFGTMGDGPGELKMPHHMAVNDHYILIMSALTQTYQLFDLEGRYIRRVYVRTRARPLAMFLTDRERVLLPLHYFEDGFKVNTYDYKGKPIANLAEFPDDSIKLILYGYHIELKGYYNLPCLDMINDHQFAMGMNHSNEIHIFDIDGKKSRSFTFKIPRRPTTDEDIYEYENQIWLGKMRNSGLQVDVVYDDLLPFYTDLYSWGDGFVLIDMKPYSKKMKGYVLRADGSTAKTFEFEAGELGHFQVSQQRMYAALEDEDGDTYEVVRLALP